MFKEVKQLEDEFGFKYASVIGIFVLSMNLVLVYHHYAIWKLAKFLIRPGHVSHAVAAHLLSHLCCTTCTGALTYHSNLSKAPVVLVVTAPCCEHRRTHWLPTGYVYRFVVARLP